MSSDTGMWTAERAGRARSATRVGRGGQHPSRPLKDLGKGAEHQAGTTPERAGWLPDLDRV